MSSSLLVLSWHFSFILIRSHSILIPSASAYDTAASRIVLGLYHLISHLGHHLLDKNTILFCSFYVPV
jgi:hypothetical protein